MKNNNPLLSSTSSLDVRLVWYFGLTTINSVLDVIFQDETALLSALVAVKTATLYYYYYYHYYHHPSSCRGPDDGITTLTLTRRAMGVCLLATTYYWWAFRMPTIWDSTMWSMQTDTVVGLWLLCHHRRAPPLSVAPPAPHTSASSHSSSSSATNKKDSTSTTTRQEPDHEQEQQQQQDQQLLCRTVAQMFGCYYAAAAFFKLNRHFFDPDASCATVFMIQHVSYYLGPLVSSYETLVQICRLVKPYAPIITVCVELAMATGLVIGQTLLLGGTTPRGGRTATRVGLLLILYFHLAVCMTPRPHDISMFAYQCGARLVVALDAASLQHTVRFYVRPHRTALLAAALIWIWYGYYYANFTPLNWAFAAYVPVLALHTTAIRLEAASAADTPKSTAATTTTTTTTMMIMKKKPFWSYLAVSVAFFYSFGSIILGLQEEHTCNMFANLKIHGGGNHNNHYLVPTGLLLRYDGPEIRIQNSTSWWFTTTYPADLSHTVEPRNIVTSVMADIGNPTPFLFNGGANRVLELFQRGYVSHNGIFVMYTVPVVEFLRLFDEAVRYDMDFDLEYVELPDDDENNNNGDDEHWRATATARTVRVQVQDGTIVQCTVVVDDNDDNGQQQPCAVDRDWVYRPYRHHVSWWRRKLSMYHGYPIVFRQDGTVRPSLTCFGP